jgi:molybdopterin synthase catalytic subunit
MVSPETGAVVTFTGVVRNINNGKQVIQIQYELYEKMVISEATKLINTALTNFDILTINVCHRAGVIKVGETAISVHVTAMHRGDAFKASEWLMNQIKHTLPIWKKETYSDGSKEWVFCSHH